MRKLMLTLAAFAAIGLVVPFAGTAKAEDTVVIHKNRDHVIVPPPFHRDDDHKTVIIKKHEHDED